jgi:hypothetical protein
MRKDDKPVDGLLRERDSAEEMVSLPEQKRMSLTRPLPKIIIRSLHNNMSTLTKAIAPDIEDILMIKTLDEEAQLKNNNFYIDPKVSHHPLTQHTHSTHTQYTHTTHTVTMIDDPNKRSDSTTTITHIPDQ